MLYKLKTLGALLVGAAAVAMLSMAVAGCGGDKGSDSKGVIVRNPQKRTPVATTTSPPPVDSATTSVPSEPEETVVSVPEPPKEVTYEEAEVVFLEKRYDRAVELFTVYTDRKSENPWGHYMLGLSAWKLGDNDSAELAFERALELDSLHVKSMLNLGRVLLDMSRPAEAQKKIETALSIDPGSNVAYRLQGRTLHELGRQEAAVAAYRQAIQIDTEDAWSMNNMAQIFIEEGLYDEALPPLARATELKSDVATFLNNLGMVLEHTGHFRAAEEAYRSAVTVDDSYEKAVLNLGRIEVVMEDPTIEPVDLTVLARSFIDQIESWSESIVAQEQPEVTEPETAVPDQRSEPVEPAADANKSSDSDSDGSGQ